MTPERFAESFLRPLVRGGTLHVGPPLGRAGLEKLRSANLHPGVVADITLGRQAVAAELLLDPIQPALDLEALRLAVAVHDLLFLAHPKAAALSARGRLADVAQFAAALAHLPASDDSDRLVARHTMLHLIAALGRTDVRVSFWVGKREFHGEEPPKRLTAWPNLRRVREERWRVGCFAEAASHPVGSTVVAALLAGSPLTDLLLPTRIEPRFELGRHARVLARADLCRLVAYAYLDEGIEKVGGTIAGAILAELDGHSRDASRMSCAFLAHLHLCVLLGSPPEPRDGRSTPRPQRLVLGGDLALRDFYGLYAALDGVAPELAAPPDVRRDPRLSRRLADHVAACAQACGPARLAELRALLVRGIDVRLSLADGR